jgi:coenzyme F420 hydrogenase subunit beta
MPGAETIYGHFESLFEAHAVDNDLRWRSSSGGCISALLIYLLESEQIDGVLHIGRSEINPMRNSAYVSRNRDEVISRAGSRYAPSSLLENLVKLLNNGDRLAVVGKPCDIVGVSQYLRKKPEYEKQIVLKISFFCMGLPSYKATDRLLELLNLAPDTVDDFWYRGKGWPGQATAIDKNERKHEMSYKDSWGRILGKGVGFRCKICPDGYGEFADISCGDAWHEKNGEPCFDESPGRSLAFIRSEKGGIIFNEAETLGYLVSTPFDVKGLEIIQKSQYERKLYLGFRLIALRLTGDCLLDFSGFKLWSNLKKVQITRMFRNFFGTIYRRRKTMRNRFFSI